MTTKTIRQTVTEGRLGYARSERATHNPYDSERYPVQRAAWNLGHAAAQHYRAEHRYAKGSDKDDGQVDQAVERLGHAQAELGIQIAGKALWEAQPFEIRTEHDHLLPTE